MEFSDNVNYVVLSNNADKKFMSKFGMYQVIDVLSFEKLKNEKMNIQIMIYIIRIYEVKTNYLLLF